MKKTITLSVIAFLLKVSLLYAQIPNNGFEQFNSDGTLRNWGNVYLLPMYVDSAGNSYVDSIVFDNYLFFPTSDAHWGSTAMEMRNAWDFTTGQAIVGAVTADNDSSFAAWGAFETISIPPQSQPFNFSFFYKYFPVNNDTAQAIVQVFDSSMNQLGEAEIFITSTATNYTLATAPIIYSVPGTVAFAFIHFRTAAYGSQASFGTRFLVDDVMFNYVTGINSNEATKKTEVYPNPFTDELHINFPGDAKEAGLKVFDVMGKEVYTQSVEVFQTKIETAAWQTGIYFAKLFFKDHTETVRVSLVR